MLTDGGDTNIDALPLEGRSKAIEALTSLLSDAKEQHLRVFTIGVGSLQGGIVPDVVYAGKQVQSKLEEALLRQIADKGRGSYYASNSYTPITLSEDLIKKMKQDSQYYDEGQEMAAGSLLQSLVSSSGIVYDLYYQIPLGIALLLLSFVFFWPESRQKA